LGAARVARSKATSDIFALIVHETLGANGGEEWGAIELVDGGEAVDDGIVAECVPEIGAKEMITDGKDVMENEESVGLDHYFNVGFSKWA
jgi:hypothetical protein